MNSSSRLSSFLSELREHAGVQTVYGDPVVAEGRTVVPVARIRYGFGGGYGTTPTETDSSTETTEGEHDERTGEGGGFGGGVVVTPVGVVELTPTGTRFVPVDERRRRLAALGVGVLAGYLLGRRVAGDGT